MGAGLVVGLEVGAEADSAFPMREWAKAEAEVEVEAVAWTQMQTQTRKRKSKPKLP